MARDTRTRIAAALTAALLTGACGGGATPGTGTGTAISPATASTASPASAPAGDGTGTAPGLAPHPSTAPPTTTAPPTAAGTATPEGAGGPALVAGRYQPLWPFTDRDQVRAWQLGYRAGGHQPWHLDPERTALSFTQGYLGFEGIDRVVRRTVTGSHARVAVGYRTPDGGRLSTAAVIHLVRYGDGADAPWEVVGTDDTTFTLTIPPYGGRVSSPLTVGGVISGVDESIRVQARQPWSAGPIGEHCCVPAGGIRRPWSARVVFHAVPGQTMTIAASTGSHVAEVERFAVTGVRPG